MRPSKAELIDLLHRALPVTVAIPDGYLSESALAEVLGVDRRWLRALRTGGIAAPRGFGRGFLYSGDEARTCAVTLRLTRLGLGVAEFARFLRGPCETATCRAGERGCSAGDCCEVLLTGLADRLSGDIGELQRLQQLLDEPAPPLPDGIDAA